MNGAAASPIVAAFVISSYWIGTIHSDLAKDLAHERELRESEVAKERELRESEVAKERELRESEVAKERELRESEVRALHSQLKMQQETAKKMMDDG